MHVINFGICLFRCTVLIIVLCTILIFIFFSFPFVNEYLSTVNLYITHSLTLTRTPLHSTTVRYRLILCSIVDTSHNITYYIIIEPFGNEIQLYDCSARVIPHTVKHARAPLDVTLCMY